MIVHRVRENANDFLWQLVDSAFTAALVCNNIQILPEYR